MPLQTFLYIQVYWRNCGKCEGAFDGKAGKNKRQQIIHSCLNIDDLNLLSKDKVTGSLSSNDSSGFERRYMRWSPPFKHCNKLWSTVILPLHLCDSVHWYFCVNFEWEIGCILFMSKPFYFIMKVNYSIEYSEWFTCNAVYVF